MIPTIHIEAETPTHTQDGYWNYDLEISINNGPPETIWCWKLATFLERGASQDIDGSGLQNWGNSQPGGWRVYDGDSQCSGRPVLSIHEDGTAITARTEGDSIDILIPEGTDPEAFLEALQQAIDEAVAANDPAEPTAQDVWEELGSYNDMDHHPIRIGKPFGSRQVYAVSFFDDEFQIEDADEDQPGQEILDLFIADFKAKWNRAVLSAKEA